MLRHFFPMVILFLMKFTELVECPTPILVNRVNELAALKTGRVKLMI